MILNTLQKLFLFVFGTLAVLTATAGILMSTNTVVVESAVDHFFDSSKPITYTPLGEQSTDPSKLKAMVKGSIYEEGDEMTVYGACFRGDGSLLPAANATFSSWFSNGTQWQFDEAMTSLNNSGRWYIHTNMTSTTGTYLTQIKCTFGGNTAIAFGEWQNPAWVVRIKTINDYVVAINGTVVSIESKVDDLSVQINNNISTVLTQIGNLSTLTTQYYNNMTNQITNFEGDVQSNFSTVLTDIANLDLGSERDTEALYNLIRSIDYNQWIFDTKDWSYSGLPNAYDWQAVDMSSSDNVWAVSDAGHIFMYNGSNWTTTNYASYDWNGVSALEANTNYGWVVGTNGTSCHYSINGATPVELTATSATECEDVEMFYSPTAINGYVVANNGDILLYNGTWTVVNNTGETGDARIEMLDDNSYLFVVQNDTLTVYDGSTWTRYTVSGADFNDVTAVYSDEVYLISDETPFKVYKFDGDSVDVDYTATGSVATGEAISAHNEYDIWVVTDTPGAFYHFDGRMWTFSEYPYSSLIGIIVGFNASAGINMKDIIMLDEKSGYAVGEDGLIMKFYNHYDDRLDNLFDELLNLDLTSQLNYTNQLVINLTTLTEAMNASMISEFNDLTTFLTAINNTIVTQFNTMTTQINDFQTFVNTSFENVYNDISVLNATVTFQYNSLISELDTMNTTIVTNFNQVFDRLTDIDTNITFVQNQITTLNTNMASNFTYTNTLIESINTSIINEINDNYNLLVQINNSNNYILSNVTYTQLYIENTLFPVVNDTYTFMTVNIWNKLLGIESTVNQTLDIVTTINGTTTEIKNDTTEILDRLPEVRAWVTQ